MASQDARLSKFDADFKQQQSEMTNKINTVLKAITDRIAGALPNDTVKNPKLSTSSVLSAQEREREGDPDHTNTIAYIEEQRDAPLLERKDIPVVDNLAPNQDDEGIEWIDVEEPVDLVNTSEESVYKSLIKEMLKKHGLMTFTDGTKEITFKTPYKDPERSELCSEGHDILSSRVILNEDDYDRGSRKPSDLEEGFYRDTIKLGPRYVTGMDDEGEVTLYLTRRSLEVLRKFHWMILGRRFNQLSHVSSPLLSRKAHLLEDKQIPSVGVFDEVFSTWMTFRGNTRDLGSFRGETDKITDVHLFHEEVLLTKRGDGVTGIKQCRRDLSSDGVRDLATASGCGEVWDMVKELARMQNIASKLDDIVVWIQHIVNRDSVKSIVA
ncbi:hypothetical protein Tco_0872563 [Tanacetum coccineum]